MYTKLPMELKTGEVGDSFQSFHCALQEMSEL